MNWQSNIRLHPLHIEDCRSHNERVKSEETGEYLFYILKYILSVDHGELTLGTISLFVGAIISSACATCATPTIACWIARIKRRANRRRANCYT